MRTYSNAYKRAIYPNLLVFLRALSILLKYMPLILHILLKMHSNNHALLYIHISNHSLLYTHKYTL